MYDPNGLLEEHARYVQERRDMALLPVHVIDSTGWLYRAFTSRASAERYARTETAASRTPFALYVVAGGAVVAHYGVIPRRVNDARCRVWHGLS